MSSVKRKETASSVQQTATQKRKKQKLEASRIIAIQPTNSSSTPGPSNASVRFGLPGSIDVEKFAEARAFEMDAMHRAMNTARENATHRVWQTLPRHLRRRAASHDVRRVPKRLRQKALAEMDPVTKKTSKKSKPQLGKARRPAKTEVFLKRQCKKTWLETHLWHAKRMKMEEMWGYRLAVQPTEKSFRPAYRASMYGARLHDASYYGVIELMGPQDALKSILCTCCPTSGVSPAAVRFSSGSRLCKTEVYTCESSERRFIGLVTIMWQPVVSKPSPSAKDVIPTLKTVEVSPAAGPMSPVRRAASSKILADATARENQPEVELELADLRGHFNIFEFVGPKSTKIITKTLVPVSQSDGGKTKQLWTSIANIQSTASVPEGMIIGITVHDPRLSLKHRIRGSENGDISTSQQLWPEPAMASSQLWNEKKRSKLAKPHFAKKAIDERKSKNLIPGTGLKPMRQDDTIPVLLIQNSRRVHDLAGSRKETSFNSIAHGWTLMFPKGWGMPFLNTFVSAGARVAGQREEEPLSAAVNGGTSSTSADALQVQGPDLDIMDDINPA